MRRPLLSLLVVVAAFSAAGTQAQVPPANPATVVREYVAAQNRGDLDAMLALLADRVETRTGVTSARISASTVSEDREQMRARLDRVLRQFPGAQSEITEIIAQDGLVITKERMSTAAGTLGSGVAVYSVRNGRIESFWLVSASSGDDR